MPHFLYMLTTEDGLRYIGVTDDPDERRSAHGRRRNRFRNGFSIG